MMINNNLGGVPGPDGRQPRSHRWQETEADSGSSLNDVIRGNRRRRRPPTCHRCGRRRLRGLRRARPGRSRPDQGPRGHRPAAGRSGPELQSDVNAPQPDVDPASAVSGARPSPRSPPAGGARRSARSGAKATSARRCRQRLVHGSRRQRRHRRRPGAARAHQRPHRSCAPRPRSGSTDLGARGPVPARCSGDLVGPTLRRT